MRVLCCPARPPAAACRQGCCTGRGGAAGLGHAVPAPVNRHSGQELTLRQDGQAADCANATRSLSLSVCYNSPSSNQQSIKKFTIFCKSSRGWQGTAGCEREAEHIAVRVLLWLAIGSVQGNTHLQRNWPFKVLTPRPQQLIIGGVQGYGWLRRCLLGLAAAIRRGAARSPFVPPQPPLLRPGLGACRS
jgi:hypothetical protein